MQAKAAVTFGSGEPFQITDITVDDPQAGESIHKSSIGDLSYRYTCTNASPVLPLFRSAGAGVVEKVGVGIKHIQPGDHIISYSSCGVCGNCLSGMAYACESFYDLNFGGKMIDGTSRLHKEDTDLSNFFGQ